MNRTALIACVKRQRFRWQLSSVDMYGYQREEAEDVLSQRSW